MADDGFYREMYELHFAREVGEAEEQLPGEAGASSERSAPGEGVGP